MDTRLPSAWSLLPDDVARLGHPGDAAHLFGRIHRGATWKEGRPDVGREAAALLERAVDLTLPRVEGRRVSLDGATKLSLAFADGARVEAVHMPRAVRSARTTICLSSQVGCAMGCTFCATAAMGLARNLDAGEIVSQLHAVLRALGPTDAQHLTIVFMGMGEPLHNVANVARAVAVMCHPAGLGVAPSRVTVSTAGLVPGIDALSQCAPRPLLAVSVNATTDEARRRIMPVTKAWGLDALRGALGRWPLRPREKLTLEYVLLDGENDTDDDADRLAAWSSGLRHNLNVIPYNAFDGAAFREPPEARVQRFVRRLQDRGRLVTVRRSRGRDADAACGMLVSPRELALRTEALPGR